MAVSLLEARRQILLNTPHIESASGSIATFNTDMSANLTDMKIHFLPVQSGSGDPSPENVRPIIGWDGVTVIKTGKNLANLNESEMLSHAWTKAFPNPFRKPGRYTISCQNMIITGSQSGSFVFLGNAVTDSSGYGLTGWTFGKSVMSVSFNVDVGALEKKYIVFRFNAPPNYASLSNAQIQIEEGLEATEYEDPPLEIPISWDTLGMKYGGYLDVLRGELVETWVSKVFDGSQSDGTWTQTSIQRFYCSMGVGPNLYYERQKNDHILCDKLWSIGASSTGSGTIKACWTNSVYTIGVRIGTEINSVELLKQWLSENPITIVNELATPNRYPLTPQTIKALKGINNIWSDANGDVEVKFWKH